MGMVAVGPGFLRGALALACVWTAACGGDDAPDDGEQPGSGGSSAGSGNSAGTGGSAGADSPAGTGGSAGTGGGGGTAGASTTGGGGSGAGEDAGADDAGASGDGAICTTCGDCEESVTVGSPAHMAGEIDYDDDPPPAGGPHNPCWADYGAYLETSLPVENWVHNLEHGAVVFVYNCPEGCDGEVAALADLVSASPRTIVTAYADMAPGFAAVSWGHRLVSECLDIDAFRAFYDAYFDMAPESVPGGAPSGC